MNSSKSSNKIVIFIIAGIGFLIMAGCCGFVFWGYGLFTDQAKDALNDNPVIQEHIGEIEEIETDFTATGNAEGEDVFVFRIKGSKGSGVVTAEFISTGPESEEVRSGTLELDSGETYDLK